MRVRVSPGAPFYLRRKDSEIISQNSSIEGIRLALVSALIICHAILRVFIGRAP